MTRGEGDKNAREKERESVCVSVCVHYLGVGVKGAGGAVGDGEAIVIGHAIVGGARVHGQAVCVRGRGRERGNVCARTRMSVHVSVSVSE